MLFNYGRDNLPATASILSYVDVESVIVKLVLDSFNL